MVGDSPEDALKGASSVAFRHACKHYGVGLHLWTDPEGSVGATAAQPRVGGSTEEVKRPGPVGNVGGAAMKAAGSTMGASEKQVKFIHILRQRLDLSEEELLGDIGAFSGVSSLSDLTKSDAHKLIDTIQSRLAGEDYGEAY